jgi:hypothetical protein
MELYYCRRPIEKCISYYTLDLEGYEGYVGCIECEKDYFVSHDRKSCIEAKNCEFFNSQEGKDFCSDCNDGYALSYEGNVCKQFDNCYKLAQGDDKCSICVANFHPNADGICERTQCYDYNDNNVCTKCFEGYYLNDKKTCEKITIENCLISDEKNEKCTKCLGNITPDANGKCNLPSPLIKGCIEYKDDGKCKTCQNDDYEITSDGNCKLIECEEWEFKEEYCAQCKAGYYRARDDNDNIICIGYDGSMDTSSDDSSRNKVEYALLLFILSLLV